MYALIKTGGKQYRVEQDTVLCIERLALEEGSSVVFDQVLLLKDANKTLVGSPMLDAAKVTGKVLEHGKAKKITIFKYKPKKYRRKQGHRQQFTKVRIEKIEAS